MKPNIKRNLLSTFTITSVLLLCLSFAYSQQQAKPAQGKPAAAQGTNQPAASSAQVERGRYIVTSVAMCTNCHTPRDARGDIENTQLLTGAPVFFQPAFRMPDWPNTCPRIRGNPAATDEEMVRLLTTGIWKTGQRLRQPMPQFRMTKEDAEAVVAYLKSLR